MSETATLPTAASAELECPKCHRSITYYDVENSTHYACPECHSYFEYEHEGPPKLFGYFTVGPGFVKQLLPLGATGTMPDGRTYRVVGFMGKAEKKSQEYRWGEYVLFSPPATYAQLAEYRGHWTFIRPAERQSYRITPTTGKYSYVDAAEGRFQIYNKYQPVVHYAVGEFDWNIRDDEKLWITEFIDPPLMLVQEKPQFSKDASWFRAEHIGPDQVAGAFGVPKEDLPWRDGTGAVQPTPGEATWKQLLYISFGLALLAVVLQLVFSTMRAPNTLIQYNFLTEQDSAATATPGQSKVFVTPSFTVDGPTALQFEMHVGLNNQWLELPVSLVNEQTGQGYEFTKSFEFYSGYEGGESWSEGSMNADATLAQIPAGSYHLNLYPQTENNTPLAGRITVIEHPVLQSNLILLLWVLLALPIGQYIRRYLHEQGRWSSSDYGPEDES